MTTKRTTKKKTIENDPIEADIVAPPPQTVPFSGEVSVAADKAGHVDEMIKLALQSKASTENLSKLMEMKYEYEARESRKLFHQKFADLQNAMPAIKKSSDVVVGGKLVYKYASLDQILSQIKPVLHEHGFTYRWTESLSVNPGFKRITCHINGYGHEETAFAEIPVMNANKMTNSVQQAGSSSTYGKRYSLCGVLGIIADVDDDGRTGTDDRQPHNAPQEQRTAPQSNPTPQSYDPQQVADKVGITREQALVMVKEAYDKAVEAGISTPQMDVFFEGRNGHDDNKLFNGLTKINHILQKNNLPIVTPK